MSSRYPLTALALGLVAMLIVIVSVLRGGSGQTPNPTQEGAAGSAAVAVPAEPTPRPTVANARDPFAIPGGAAPTSAPQPTAQPTPTAVSPTAAPRPTTTTSPRPTPTAVKDRPPSTTSGSGSGTVSETPLVSLRVLAIDPALQAARLQINGQEHLLKVGDGIEDNYLVGITSETCVNVRSFVAGKDLLNPVCIGESVEIIGR